VRPEVIAVRTEDPASGRSKRAVEDEPEGVLTEDVMNKEEHAERNEEREPLEQIDDRNDSFLFASVQIDHPRSLCFSFR
jgi:hypothetical protein